MDKPTTVKHVYNFEVVYS